ncbi:MAG: ATP/GTP-binding protein [Actinomycetota bacterium]|nr:ATP/GTP-binding protein [Actinomycetota bacterium]
MSRAGIVRRQRPESPAARPLKIVVTGPFAAGKTSLIQTISDVTVLGTERTISDETEATKDTTTVAMDFGRIELGGQGAGGGPALFLFGTPGQQRFEVMWEILSEGMIGFILLVNASDGRSADQAAAQLRTFRRYADVPFVVGVTHLDAPGAASLEGVRTRLDVGDAVPVVACDPRSRDDVKGLMLRILFGVLERLDAAGAEPVAVSS